MEEVVGRCNRVDGRFDHFLIQIGLLFGAQLEAALDLEANLGRLRFLQLGSILAPIKRTKSDGFSELCLAESTDSLG